MKTLIRSGRIVTAQDDYHADVLIEHESIAAIGRNLTVEAEAVFDASGLLVIPGGIDVHTHLDMPFGGTEAIRRILDCLGIPSRAPPIAVASRDAADWKFSE